MRNSRRTRGAFTLIELLTVIAIITLLIGILTPALGRARDEAKKTAIRAQLQSISTGLEMFQNDQGKYAASNAGEYSGFNPAENWEVGTSGQPLQGANLLVDAMVGRDFIGYDPKPSRQASGSNPAYDRWNRNNQRRTKYIDPAGINSSQKSKSVEDAFGAVSPTPVPDNDPFNPTLEGNVSVLDSAPQYCPVFLDKFDFPILYYRANPNQSPRSPILPILALNGTTHTPTDNAVFNGYDNREFTDHSAGSNPGQRHEIHQADQLISAVDDLTNNFARYINSDRASSKDTNGNITFARPVNAEKFLLISPGKDGIYGTLDDVKNWE